MPGLDGAEPPLRRTAFVGREPELAQIATQWELARRGAQRVLLVTGDAGIGKSRLIAQFRDVLQQQGQHVLECHGLATTSGSAFASLSATLRRLLQLRDSEPADAQRQKIVQSLPAGVDADEALALIGALLSLDGAPAEDASPRQRQRTLALLLRWFRLAVGAQPLCLLLDDAHWVDPSTREFVARLLAEAADTPDSALMLLVGQRSDDDGAWQLPRVDQTIALRGLAPDEARAMARAACGDHALPRDVLRLLAARSDGVPLFLEESVAVALEAGGSASGSLHPLRMNVPATLQDLLMARLDRLGEARAVAQLGAALGREFPEALLRAAVLTHGSVSIDPLTLQALLARLEQSGLLLRGRGSACDGIDTTWIFKHALIRDTAYQSLWERDRQHVHRDVAAVLATQFPALVARQPELLAHHQTKAGLDAQALAQWEVAARRAASVSAHEESISHIENALLLLANQTASAERDNTELRLQLLLASRYIATEGYGADRVERVYARAATLCRMLGNQATSLKVELGLHGWHFMRGELRRAHEIALRSEAMAQHAGGDTMQQLQANWAVAITQFHLGESAPAVDRMDRCLAVYRSDMHRPGAVQDPGVMCLCYSAWAQWELGHVDEALVRTRRVIALAEQIDHKFSLGVAYGFAASVHLFRGETEAALAAAERAAAICDEGGFVVWLAHALVMRGRLRCDQGVFDAGLADMREGHAMWVDTGAAVTLPMYLSLHAEGCALAGRPAEGIALLEEAMAQIERTGERYHEAEVRRLMGELRWQLCCEGGVDETGGYDKADVERADAENWLAGARSVAQRQHKRSFQLRAASGLARIWIAHGRAAGAAAMLEAALLAMPDGGAATRDVRAARQLMAEAHACNRERVRSAA